MAGGAPQTTTTSSSSASAYNLPHTASSSHSNWNGPKTGSGDYSERAWTTKNPSPAHALLNLRTMEVLPVSSLELQNLSLMDAMKDKSTQSANFMMHGGAGLVKNNVNTAVHMGTEVASGDYVGAAFDGAKLAKGSFKVAKGINSQSTQLGKMILLI